MSKNCPLCEKKSMITMPLSNRIRATKYNPTAKKRKYPNLQWLRLPNGPRIKACTKCIKTFNKPNKKIK